MAQRQQQEQLLPHRQQQQQQQQQQPQQQQQQQPGENHQQLPQQLSEATALRLLNSAMANAATANTTTSSNGGSRTDAAIATEMPPNGSMATGGIGGTGSGGGGGGGGGGSGISGGGGSSGRRPTQLQLGRLLPAPVSQESGQSADEPHRQQQQQQQPQQQQQQQPGEHHQQLPQQLSEATALRLLNSAMANAATANTTTSSNGGAAIATHMPPNDNMATGGIGETGSGSSSGRRPTQLQLGRLLPAQASQESGQSADEPGNACRICRVHRSDAEVIDCPCRCKGSVGHIHLMCLKRWIIQSGNNRCEICNTPFNLTADRASFRQMVRAFCCGRCCGMILKHILFSASLMPLTHVILQQVLHCMDNMNQGNTEQLTMQEVFVASCALLTSSALFFHFFEFVTTRFLLIRNILRHWWLFGSTNDFGLVEVEDDTFDLF